MTKAELFDMLNREAKGKFIKMVYALSNENDASSIRHWIDVGYLSSAKLVEKDGETNLYLRYRSHPGVRALQRGRESTNIFLTYSSYLVTDASKRETGRDYCRFDFSECSQFCLYVDSEDTPFICGNSTYNEYLLYSDLSDKQQLKWTNWAESVYQELLYHDWERIPIADWGSNWELYESFETWWVHWYSKEQGHSQIQSIARPHTWLTDKYYGRQGACHNEYPLLTGSIPTYQVITGKGRCTRCTATIEIKGARETNEFMMLSSNRRQMVGFTRKDGYFIAGEGIGQLGKLQGKNFGLCPCDRVQGEDGNWYIYLGRVRSCPRIKTTDGDEDGKDGYLYVYIPDGVTDGDKILFSLLGQAKEFADFSINCYNKPFQWLDTPMNIIGVDKPLFTPADATGIYSRLKLEKLKEPEFNYNTRDMWGEVQR